MRTAPWWRCCAPWPAGNPEGSVPVAVLTTLSSCLKTLLYQPSCPLCSQPLTDDQDEQRPCESCNRRLGLRSQLLHGRAPLTWVAAGLYSGALRQVLLQLRRSRDTKTIAALCANLRDHLPSDARLVPIPSWKNTSRANPLPALLCQGLNRPTLELLQRSRPGLGQHHLQAHQRQSNQQEAFHAVAPVAADVGRSNGMVWIVDDILTTGATAVAAQAALTRAKLPVAGLVCLARTPRRSASSERRDL